jgi:hypothetical protein
LILLIAFASPCCAGDRRPTRLAIVDVGSGQRVSEEFVDFLTLALGQEPQVALLERGQVERILREQSLGMMLAGTNAVRAGKLVAADAFLMLELQTNQTVRVLLVDAHYGLRLWDVMFALTANPGDSEERARSLAKGTVFRLANFVCGTDTPRTVSVSAFRSEEMSKRWDWLGETLGAAIEQRLSLQPGLVVMERAQTRPLTEERELTQGLPESLLASTVIVDGAYRIDRAQGTNAVIMTLRCRRNNVTTLETTVPGSVTNLAELEEKAVAIIATNVGSKAGCGSMDPAAESAMLADEASGMLAHEPQRALSLAEAASALQPDNIDYDGLVVKAYARWLGNTSDEFIANSLHGLAVLERIARRTGQFPGDANLFLGSVSSGLASQIAHSDDPAGVQELRSAFWRTVWVCHDQLKSNKSKDLFAVLLCISGACQLYASTTEAIEHSRLVLFEFVDAFEAQHPPYLNSPLDEQGGWGLVAVYNRPRTATWPLEPGAGDRLAAFLDELCHSQDVVVRMLAERASMRFYGQPSWQPPKEDGAVDFEKAQEHARVYVQCVAEARRIYSYLGEDYRTALRNVRFAMGEKENQQFQDRLVLILEPIPKPTEPSSKPIYKPAEVVSLQGDLKKRLEIPTRYPDIHFRRIICHDNVAAIVYTQGPTVNERCGVVWLDPNTFEPQVSAYSTVALPSEESGRSVTWEYMQYGPSVACIGTNIFVGFPQTGILVFAKDQKVKWLNESSGLPDQGIRDLGALDGKLYAFVGTPFGFDKETGVMEVDPVTLVSRMLISSRAKFKSTDIDQREIVSIAADQRRHALWVLTPDQLFLYRPADGVVTNRSSMASLFFKGVHLSASVPRSASLEACNEDLLLVRLGGCFRLGPQSEQLEALVAGTDVRPGVKSRWPQQDIWPVFAKHPILVADDLIVREDRSSTAWIFRKGEPKSEDLLRLCFPQEVVSKLTIRDLASSPRGLLILTDDALYLVPEIGAEPIHQ